VLDIQLREFGILDVDRVGLRPELASAQLEGILLFFADRRTFPLSQRIRVFLSIARLPHLVWRERVADMLKLETTLDFTRVDRKVIYGM
jgi:hypothetical protein